MKNNQYKKKKYLNIFNLNTFKNIIINKKNIFKTIISYN